MDPACVAVGLLHDVLEDTLTEPDRIQEYFGDDVLHIVEGVTKISKIPFSSSEERQAENFRKLLLAMVDDVRVILVKLADRLHNMRTLQYLPDERRVRIARETMDIYAPLAGRLGMSKIKNELEDLSFQYLEPEAYKELERTRGGEARAGHRLHRQDQGARWPRSCRPPAWRRSVEGRIKRLYSIHQKLQRQRIDLDQVYDFVALRVVVASIPDCYAALGILHNLWRPVPGRIKDFIAMPRPNGYQSLHTSVIGDEGQPFEVQIRTLRDAPRGRGGHRRALEVQGGPQRRRQGRPGLRLAAPAPGVAAGGQGPARVPELPEARPLPGGGLLLHAQGRGQDAAARGAAAIDFAYAIHTEVGHQCVGARVNGKMVPLRYKLKNGDIVEILTSAGHHPSRDWLASPSPTRRAQQDPPLPQHRREAAGAGHRPQALRARAEALRPVAEEDRRRPSVEALAHDLGVGTQARGPLRRRGLRQALHAPGAGQAACPRRSWTRRRAREAAARSPDAVKRLLRVGEERIKVKGSDDLLIYRAKCCNPIMGEPIVGYITRGKGVSVHAQTLPERGEPALRPRAPHRGGVGPRRGRRLRGADRGRGGGPARACWPPSPPSWPA